MKTELQIELRYDLEVEKTDDRWVVKSHVLGLTGYGVTAESAVARLEGSIDFFVNGYLESRGLPELRKWFDAHEIKHNIASDKPGHRLQSGSEYSERRVRWDAGEGDGAYCAPCGPQ